MLVFMLASLSRAGDAPGVILEGTVDGLGKGYLIVNDLTVKTTEGTQYRNILNLSVTVDKIKIGDKVEVYGTIKNQARLAERVVVIE